MGEWLSVRTASVLVTDAEEVRTYYRVRHETDSVMVPVRRGAAGARIGAAPPSRRRSSRARYVLYVSRWERENNPLLVAAAHAASRCDALRLVMLGAGRVRRRPGARGSRGGPVRRRACPGPVYGDGYRGLIANARCYVHATEVGGTHPALIEAMGAGNLCLVLDTPENREVAGDVAWYFADGAELAKLLERVAELDHDELGRAGERPSASAARQRYSWDAVADVLRRSCCSVPERRTATRACAPWSSLRRRARRCPPGDPGHVRAVGALLPARAGAAVSRTGRLAARRTWRAPRLEHVAVLAALGWS